MFRCPAGNFIGFRSRWTGCFFKLQLKFLFVENIDQLRDCLHVFSCDMGVYQLLNLSFVLFEIHLIAISRHHRKSQPQKHRQVFFISINLLLTGLILKFNRR
uniref:hypothetical protein n=1 Tax=Dyadobacter pollutisoli TaxID=2910158 RepID=UPI0035B614A2